MPMTEGSHTCGASSAAGAVRLECVYDGHMSTSAQKREGLSVHVVLNSDPRFTVCGKWMSGLTVVDAAPTCKKCMTR
jgi:hypothetical protein